MDKRLDRIEAQLDKMNELLGEYNVQLAIHVEGVVQNRTHISKVEMQITKLEKELDKITVHVHEVQGIGKFLKWIAAGTGFVLSVLGVLQLLGVI